MKLKHTKMFILAFVAWEWISSVTKSIFKLASYIVELPMVASGVYIMIATGIPSWNNLTLFNLAFGVLLSAPEILAPGAFFRAETMQSRGKTHAARVTRWIAGAMLFFSALTFSSVMIFHFPDQWLQAIMFCRVITALGYSIITRIDMDHDADLPPAMPSVQMDSWFLVALAAHMQDQFASQLTELAEQQKISLIGLVNEKRLAEVFDLQLQKWNLVDLQVQRLLTEVQELQFDASQPPDYDALTQIILTRLQEQFDAQKRGQVASIQEEMTHQIDAPKPRQKSASKSKHDAASFLRQTSASKTDKKASIHALLAQNMGLTSYYLAAEVGCSEATARRIKREYLTMRQAQNDASENDA